MIVGNGMIAQRLASLPAEATTPVLLFASGVSNSKETDPAAFAREGALLDHWLAEADERLFVYFSTCSVDDPAERHSPYVQHKLALEAQIRARAGRYLICRTSNVVGGRGNPHTVLNYFFERCQRNETFVVWQHATRNLIDADDVLTIVRAFIADTTYHNQTLNVAYPHSLTAPAIVQGIEQFLGRNATYRLENKGVPFAIRTDEATAVLASAGPVLPAEAYLARLLDKYYR